jgi:NTE family protein
MLLFHPASPRRTSSARIGLAIAGGGPIGGMYELGALRALDDAIEGLDLTQLHVYVGVSSGAFLAAGLANRMSTAEMCRIFITGDPDDARFRPQSFLKPAFQEYFKRAAGLPGILFNWWRDALTRPGEINLSEALGRLSGLVPTGIFDNSEVEQFLRDAFTRRGRTNDFRELGRQLYVVAVDLDNGEAVRFGGADWNDIPISKAVQASSALPGLYPPVEIRDRQFVDGALRRTMHASVALEQDIDLLIGLNPLVPFDASRARAEGKPQPESLITGGLPVVLSQTFRTLLQSRVQVGMAKYAQQYEHVDQIVFEPNPDDAEMFFTNIFSYSSRQRLCEHAYQTTLADLRGRRDALAAALAPHGLSLRDDVLDDPERTLLGSLSARPRRQTNTTARLRRALDDVDSLVKERRARG